MFTLFTESTENSTPVAGQFILGLEADGAEFRYPLGAALATLFSDSSSTSVAVPRLKQLTSTTSDPTVSDYGAGEWGVHKNTSTGDLFLAYNDGGAMSNLSLSGGDDWGSQVVETDATLAGNGTAGSPLSVVASGGDDWGSQVVETDATLAGNGTAGSPLSVVASGLTNWEESGTTLQPTTAGYDLGATGKEVGDIVSSGTVVSTQLACTPSPGTASSDQLVLNTHHGINSTGSSMLIRVNTEQLAAFYRSSFKGLGITSGGAISWGSNGLSSFQTYLRHIASNHLGMYNGVNPQSFSLYNTYADVSNFERGGMRWDANALVIGTEAAGTGSGRDVHIKNLPTSNPGPGILWNNAGTPAIGT